MENRQNMHSQKRRELTEDSTQFLITSAGEPVVSANTNDSELVDSDEQNVEVVEAASIDESLVESSSETSAVETNEENDLNPNQALGSYLRHEREAQNTAIADIAKTTKIPKASLLALEDGRFSDLPGDVFVRGFLRSYARCLKLNGDEVIRRYAQCGLCPAPVSSDMADSLLAPNERRARSFGGTSTKEAASTAPAVAKKSKSASLAEVTKSSKKRVSKVIKDAFDLARSPSETSAPDADKSSDLSSSSHKIEVVDMSSDTAIEAPAEEKRVRVFVPPALNFGEERASRGPLTLGVIILVIVATLTMSYLLQRPGTSTEGFTQLDQESLQQDSESAPLLGPVQLG